MKIEKNNKDKYKNDRWMKEHIVMSTKSSVMATLKFFIYYRHDLIVVALMTYLNVILIINFAMNILHISPKIGKR